MTFRQYLLNLYRQLHAAEVILVGTGQGELPPRGYKMLRWLERRYE